MDDKLRLLVCSSLAAEVTQVVELEGWQNVAVSTFPLSCTMGGPGHAGVEHAIAACPEDGSTVVVIGGFCVAELSGLGVSKRVRAAGGRPPLRAVAAAAARAGKETGPEFQRPLGSGGWCRVTTSDGGMPVCALDRCLDIVLPGKMHDALVEDGAHLVTPGWVAEWPDRVREWGFDRSTARDFFAESVARVVLLDTGIDPSAGKNLEAFADFVDRRCDTVPIGLEFLRLFLARIVGDLRLVAEGSRREAIEDEARRHQSDYAMALDVIGGLTEAEDEDSVLRGIADLLEGLCAPQLLVLLPILGGKPGTPRLRPCSHEIAAATLESMLGLATDHAWSGKGDAIVFRLRHGHETLGVVRLDGFALPGYAEHYHSLTRFLAPVFALALAKARTFQSLKEALANVKTLRGLLPICSYCHKVRDDGDYWHSLERYIGEHSEATLSHGICPECYSKHWQPQIDKLRKR